MHILARTLRGFQFCIAHSWPPVSQVLEQLPLSPAVIRCSGLSMIPRDSSSQNARRMSSGGGGLLMWLLRYVRGKWEWVLRRNSSTNVGPKHTQPKFVKRAMGSFGWSLQASFSRWKTAWSLPIMMSSWYTLEWHLAKVGPLVLQFWPANSWGVAASALSLFRAATFLASSARCLASWTLAAILSSSNSFCFCSSTWARRSLTCFASYIRECQGDLFHHYLPWLIWKQNWLFLSLV